MLFSEIYSVYYKAVSRLITKAIDAELNSKDAVDIIETQAFSESFLYILDNINAENWYVLSKEFKTPIKNYPPKVITTLEKRFLKTISLDPRFKLFCDLEIPEMEGVTPFYTKDDLYYFDIINDGDPFEDEEYILNFKKIIVALEKNKLLKIVYRGGKGILQKGIFTPRKLEYSQKDDKFRLLCLGKHAFATINVARIKSIEFVGVFDEKDIKPFNRRIRTVTLQIADHRNALERCMLHFSHFEKETRKIDDLNYEMKLSYYADDETEVLIRVLSFGPMIKVTQPDSFVSLIKERLNNQKSYE